jgi:hypothetical protein
MIQSIDVELKGAEPIRLVTPDTDDPYPEEHQRPDGTIESLELTVDQHYGLKLSTGPDGVVLVQLREAGAWTEPTRFVDLVRQQFQT